MTLPRPLATAARVGVIVVTLSLLSALRSEARRTFPSEIDTLLVPAPIPAWVVRTLAMGLESAAADLSYMQAIQLFGERLAPGVTLADRLRRGEAIARLIDRATDLDPAFGYAYVFAAVAVPVPTENGLLRNLPQTESLLRKGVAAVPDDWRIPFHLAYLKSAQEADFAEAAKQMAEAARRPGAPAYLPLLATRLAAQGGAIEAGIAVAEARLRLATEEDEREEIAGRIRLLVMEGHLRKIEAALARYAQLHGQAAASLDALVADGLLGGLPEEPHGGRYVLEADGTVKSDSAQRLRLGFRAMKAIEEALAEGKRAQATGAEAPGPWVTEPADAGSPASGGDQE